MKCPTWRKWSVPLCVVMTLPAITSHAQDVSGSPDSSRRSSVVITTADPAPTPVAPQELLDEDSLEIVKERYDNATIKIERAVSQDADGNYINHGPWKMWDERGTLIAQGTYHQGRRHGSWSRWYKGPESKLFSETPYREFAGPFISQADFQHGKLHGKWTIYDSKQNPISEIEYVDGLRHGTAVWHFANGQKMREAIYREGAIDGELLQWDAKAQLIAKDKFQNGRKIAPKVAFHKAGQRSSEGMYLHAKLAVQTSDDWWNAIPATYAQHGKDEKHGTWTSWYPNGQMQMTGEYEYNAEVGKFSWWYANGQKSLEGIFELGKQDGTWTWWHSNGLKKIQGEYVMGIPTGNWAWWKEDGKIAQKADLSGAQSDTVSTPQPSLEASLDRPLLLDLTR